MFDDQKIKLAILPWGLKKKNIFVSKSRDVYG